LDPAYTRNARNLGEILLEGSKVQEAIFKLKEALVVNPDDLVARNALANAYGTEIRSQSISPDWDEALRHKDIVIEQLKAGKKFYTDGDADTMRKRIMLRKAIWLRELKRYEGSRELLRVLLEEEPSDDSIRFELIRTLCQYRKFSEVVESLQAIESDIDESTNTTALSRFLQNHATDDIFHSVLVSAFREAYKFECVTDYYRMAIKDCASKADLWSQWIQSCLMDGLASMLFKFGASPAERNEAVALWEKMFNEKGGRLNCVQQLCKAYIAQAREAGPNTPIADSMVAKIRAWLPGSNEETKETNSTSVDQAEVRALLARYYRSVGSFAEARETLRPDMELALKLLSDDDPDNDWQGYRKLGDALMDFGGMEEAQTAWSLIQPTQGISHLLRRPSTPNGSASDDTPFKVDESSEEDRKVPQVPALNGDADASPENTSPSSDRPQLNRANTSMAPTGPLNYRCDGRCGTHWTYADNFYVCCECIDTQFCPDCLENLQAEELERDVCDAKHQFLYVPAWTLESAQRARDNKVLVRGEEKEIDSWLKEIELAWHLKVVANDIVTIRMGLDETQRTLNGLASQC
jgi:tetratricopeptide (TPR) repeat protein